MSKRDEPTRPTVHAREGRPTYGNPTYEGQSTDALRDDKLRRQAAEQKFQERTAGDDKQQDRGELKFYEANRPNYNELKQEHANAATKTGEGEKDKSQGQDKAQGLTFFEDKNRETQGHTR